MRRDVSGGGRRGARRFKMSCSSAMDRGIEKRYVVETLLATSPLTGARMRTPPRTPWWKHIVGLNVLRRYTQETLQATSLRMEFVWAQFTGLLRMYSLTAEIPASPRRM